MLRDSNSAGSRRVLICFAVKGEAQPYLRTVGSKRVDILITGMGEQNAARELEKVLATFQPKLILTCGFAGGLNPKLRTGTVIFSTDDETLRGNLLSAGATPATFHCGKRVAITRKEKAELFRETHSDAVEMESAVIQKIATENGIASGTVRVISDDAGEDLPLDFNSLMTREFEINLPKLILHVLLRPWKIPALLALQKKTAAAAENLSRVLNSLPI